MTRIACSVIGGLLLLALGGDSLAGHCDQFFVQKQVKQVVVKQQVQHVAAPVYAVNVPVYYGVGAHLQYEALRQKAATQAEFEAFQRWRLSQQAPQQDHVPDATKMVESVIGQKCASCHGRQLTTPKGELYLDTGLDLAPEHVVEALRQIRDDLMPPGKPLTPEEKAAIMQELLEAGQ